ncbi:hypothetical protein SAMN04490243_2311 [Robiginitalea myxolifaciens]|uniref:Uncharacterized protein n=1 Tax=Robiginitalea myxolifaciens TaxID=400055 RepID=A0A1I6H5X0_9FLAO|nr:hypothetical protein [Robiginitalea myxolifaciens]SFR49865.1 hypothetical protein SAMN04490243_2311 [Robiginitalea myxolifaciens]
MAHSTTDFNTSQQSQSTEGSSLRKGAVLSKGGAKRVAIIAGLGTLLGLSWSVDQLFFKELVLISAVISLLILVNWLGDKQEGQIS